MSTCNMIKSACEMMVMITCHINHVDIYKSYVNIIMFHVDIIFMHFCIIIVNDDIFT